MAAIGTAVVLWYGGDLVLTGRLSAGSLVVLIWYLGKIYKPMQASPGLPVGARAAKKQNGGMLETKDFLALAPRLHFVSFPTRLGRAQSTALW